MGRTSCLWTWAGVFAWGVTLVAEPERHCQRSKLPSNMEIAPALSRALETLYEQSPTFKAQCERLATAKSLRITIRVDHAMPSFCRAFTTFQRAGRDLRADVRLPTGRAMPEMAAHELEHVLEQIDGLDLRKLARIRGAGVRVIEGEMFETDRAQRAGRIVAEEVSRGRRTPEAD